MRLELTEAYPGEARDKASEIFKALATRLGGKVRVTPRDSLEPATEPATALTELSPFQSQRELSARLEAVGKARFDRMLTDLDRLLSTRGGA